MASPDPGSMPGAWGVLGLFLIPVGGGIPGGVLLAKSRGIRWPVMMALYFVSDVILAMAFDPLMNLIARAAKKSAFLERVGEAMRQSTLRTAARYGHGGPLSLVLVAFGVDPMTGRVAAAMAGHGFVSGWAIAIAGDMMYFTVLMVCTLWLQSLVGDGTSVMLLVFVIMLVLPALFKRWRERAASA